MSSATSPVGCRSSCGKLASVPIGSWAMECSDRAIRRPGAMSILRQDSLLMRDHVDTTGSRPISVARSTNSLRLVAVYCRRCLEVSSRRIATSLTDATGVCGLDGQVGTIWVRSVMIAAEESKGPDRNLRALRSSRWIAFDRGYRRRVDIMEALASTIGHMDRSCSQGPSRAPCRGVKTLMLSCIHVNRLIFIQRWVS